jgi:hypothetical protein
MSKKWTNTNSSHSCLYIDKHSTDTHTHKDTHRQRTKQTQTEKINHHILLWARTRTRKHKYAYPHLDIHTKSQTQRHTLPQICIQTHRCRYSPLLCGRKDTQLYFFRGGTYYDLSIPPRNFLHFFPQKISEKVIFFPNICIYLFFQKRVQDDMSSRKIKNRVPLLLARIFDTFRRLRGIGSIYNLIHFTITLRY